MSVKIRIPTTLRILTAGESEVGASEGTVADIIGQLCRNYPDFEGRLVDEAGNLMRFVNMYLEDEDIRFLQGLETVVADGQTISIIPAVAGGSMILIEK